jgi:heat shock protein HslJ
MKNNRIVLSILIVFTIFMASCKKEKTKTELLTNKAWLRTALTVNPGIPAGAMPTLKISEEKNLHGTKYTLSYVLTAQ